jgi:hypothetical protein
MKRPLPIVEGRVDQKYAYCLAQVIEDCLERALEARARKRETADPDARAFEAGRLMAFNELISICQQECSGFLIDLGEVGLEGIEPDRDLV